MVLLVPVNSVLIQIDFLHEGTDTQKVAKSIFGKKKEKNPLSRTATISSSTTVIIFFIPESEGKAIVVRVLNCQFLTVQHRWPPGQVGDF